MSDPGGGAVSDPGGGAVSDCPGINVVMGHGWNEQQHCPGCAGDSLLREQLADVTAQRDLLMAMCPAEKETAQLREQLAQARVWMQHRLKESAHLMHTQACAIQSPKTGFALGRCTCGLRELLADLPNEKEKP